MFFSAPRVLPRGGPSALACLLVVLAAVTSAVQDPTERLVDDEINKLGTSQDRDEMTPARRFVDSLVAAAVSGAASTDDLFRNASGFGDNALWRDLIVECGASVELACVKKNVFKYLDRTVSASGNVTLADGVVFERNQRVWENKYERRLNEGVGVGDGEGSEGRALGSFEDVTDALMDKGERFLHLHDLRLQLPSVIMDGAVLRLSPRALAEGGGALLTIEPPPAAPEGRILFKHKKIRRRLLLALFALLLVVKLLKVAAMFLMPIILGVGTAKKILLKVLLFLFPALTHLFKFCSYYHGLHASKFHHHHHQIGHHHHHLPAHILKEWKMDEKSDIAHHHHHVPVHVPVPVHVHHDHHDHHESGPGHPFEDAGPPIYASAPGPSYHGGGGGGPPAGPWAHDYTSRSEMLAAAQHNENELASWGLGGGPGGVARDTFGIADHAQQLAYNAYSYLDDGRVSRSAQPVTEPTKVFPASASHTAPAKASFLQLVQKPQQKKDQVDQTALLRAQAQHALLLRQQHLQQLQQQQLKQQQQQALRLQVVTPKPVPATTIQVTYDPFYSPILQRMDNVFVGLGFNEEACRERLVCSMYKNPPKFSPHSNLISNELSRDASELQKPAVQNSAVARFHRYVQAARDGQEQRDCLRLYPACTVNTEL